MFNTLFLSACLMSLALTHAEDVEMCVEDICAKILGQSGKIDFTFDEQTIQVTMDSIVEVDSNGDVVGNTGSTKHSFNSFASQDFVFSDLYSTTYQNLSATAINFTASLVDDTSNFDVQLYLFLEDGAITNHNQDYSVSRGSFKFSYNWDYWPFCTIGGSGVTECTKGGNEQEGAFLDFKIILRGNSDASSGTNGTLVYDDNSMVYMPSDYYASGWEVMPDGYPLEVLQGSKTEITFRFARFDEGLYYDPILNWGTGDVSDGDTGGASSLPNSPVLAVTALVGLLVAL